MEKNLGRGQRLKSVINDYHNKSPKNFQDQLKISSYEYTNESIEKFCNGLESNEAKSSSSSKEVRYIPADCIKTESEVSRNYLEEFPPLGLQTSRGPKREEKSTFYFNDVTKECFDQCYGNQSHAPSQNTTCYTEDVTATASRSPQKSKNIAKGIGRGQRLRMVADSMPQHGASLSTDIERAYGTGYTNQSIEQFVKKLTEKNEQMN